MRFRALVVLTTLASLLVWNSSAALANDRSAERRMMTKADVPSSFGTPTSSDFDAKIIGKRIGICDTASGETLVSVPAPAKQYVVDIETRNGKTYTEIMERVYQFPNAQRARDAFNTLFNDLQSCDGTTALTNQQPSLRQTVTTGSYPGGEYADFWINVSGTWSGGELKRPSRTVLQAVYVQAGNAIVETVAYINGRSQLTKKQRDDLADLAMQLGQRWAGS
jgi:hypothetical protein